MLTGPAGRINDAATFRKFLADKDAWSHPTTAVFWRGSRWLGIYKGTQELPPRIILTDRDNRTVYIGWSFFDEGGYVDAYPC